MLSYRHRTLADAGKEKIASAMPAEPPNEHEIALSLLLQAGFEFLLIPFASSCAATQVPVDSFQTERNALFI